MDQVATSDFDLSTAVPETDDGKAISTAPDFDLKSAVPEESLEASRPQDNAPEEQAAPLRQEGEETMKQNIEQTTPSPLSEAVRGFIKNVGRGGLEEFKEADYAYTHPNETPEQQEAALDKAEVAKGVMGQLGDTFNMAIMAVAPELSPKGWATLGTFMMADTTRQAMQKIFLPDLSPSAKDVLDIAAFPLEGGMAHEAVTGIGDMISKAFTIKGVSPTIDLQPDLLKLFAEPQVTERPAPFVKASQEGWPAPDVETPTGVMSGGILDKLGVTQNHYDVSQSTGLPVRVPITKLFDISQDDDFDKFSLAVMEGEGGAVSQAENILKEGSNAESGGGSTQEGSVKEGTEGQATVSNDLRDNAEGGVEAKQGEEVKQEEGEQVTSKIAKSIEQKAIDDKLTTKFDNLAGAEKVNVEEQSKLATDLVNKNIDDARAIIRGEKPLPGKLRGISLVTAMEEHLKNNPDPDIAYELANSPLVSATTKAAQELRLAAEREPDSFTKKMNELRQSIIDSKDNKDTGKLVKLLKTESSKINLSKDELKWDKFLDSIQC